MRIFDLTPGGFIQPASNPATVTQEGGTDKIACLSFSASTSQGAIAAGVIPELYNAGTITVEIHYFIGTTTGTLTFEGQWEIRTVSDAMGTDSFAAVQSTTVSTLPSPADDYDVATITFSSAQADGAAAGKPYRFKLLRNISDTAAQPAKVFRVHAYE